jgi:ankyrin repeat protein
MLQACFIATTLKSVDLNLGMEDGSSALLVAVQQRDVEMVKLLLAAVLSPKSHKPTVSHS